MVHFWTMSANGRLRKVGIRVVFAAVLSGSAPASASGAGASVGRHGGEAPRVVAVGDIHGALDSLREILESAGLIDGENRWIGGRSVLVQTGDFLDRGADALQTADFLRELQKQAEKSGGEAIVLMGNHEAMNLIGDLRYVSPAEYAHFVDDKSEKRREAAAKKYAHFMKSQASRMHQPEPDLEALKRSWLESRPAGFVERMEAFSEGDLFRWLQRLPAAVRVGDTIFLHGGIHPDLSDWSLERFNSRIAKEVANFAKLKRRLAEEGLILPFFDLQEMETSIRLELRRLRDASFDLRRETRIGLMEEFLNTRSWLIRHPDGPLWFRGFANWTEQDGGLVANLLKSYGARRFVVGHNTTASRRIETRFDGAIVLIDTGMLSAYYPGGNPAALEINGEATRALYRSEPPLLQAPADAAAAGPARRPQP